MEKEITMQEALELINEALTRTEERISEQVSELRTELKQDIADLRSEMNDRFTRVDQRLEYHETWLKRLDKGLAECATKRQMERLTGVLEDKHVISRFDTAFINSPT